MDMLAVGHEECAAAVVVRVKGAVDSATAGEFVSHLATALERAATHPAHVAIVDLQGVIFFGSAGLNAVLDCHQKARATGTAVRLVADHPEVVRPIEVTKLDRILVLCPSLDEAVRHRDDKVL